MEVFGYKNAFQMQGGLLKRGGRGCMELSLWDRKLAGRGGSEGKGQTVTVPGPITRKPHRRSGQPQVREQREGRERVWVYTLGVVEGHHQDNRHGVITEDIEQI